MLTPYTSKFKKWTLLFEPWPKYDDSTSIPNNMECDFIYQHQLLTVYIFSSSLISTLLCRQSPSSLLPRFVTPQLMWQPVQEVEPQVFPRFSAYWFWRVWSYGCYSKPDGSLGWRHIKQHCLCLSLLRHLNVSVIEHVRNLPTLHEVINLLILITTNCIASFVAWFGIAPRVTLYHRTKHVHTKLVSKLWRANVHLRFKNTSKLLKSGCSFNKLKAFPFLLHFSFF